jgi:prolyl oligopeptidase
MNFAIAFNMKRFTYLSLIAGLFSCRQNANDQSIKINYPEIQASSVTENYFGKSIEDRYRTLENVQDKKVVNWMQAEKKLTDSVLNKIPFRDSLKIQLEEYIFSTNLRGGFPRAAKQKLFYPRLFLKERIEKIFYRDSLLGKEVEIFDTKSVNHDSVVYDIYYFEPSLDGKYLACGLSANGGSISIIKIIDVVNNKILPETIERTNYASPCWIPGQLAFYYTQLKEIKSEQDAQTIYEDGKVKLHIVGTDPKTDKNVISRQQNSSIASSKLDLPFITMFPGSDYAMAFVVRGSTQYVSVYSTKLSTLVSAGNNAVWNQISSDEEMVTNFAVYGDYAYLLSFKNNPNGILKKYNLVEKKTSILIEGKDEILEELIQTTDYVYLKKLKNGFNSVVRIDPKTDQQVLLTLPYTGTVSLKPPFQYPLYFINSPDLFFTMESWNKEVSGYVYQPQKSQVQESGLRSPGKYGNPNDIIVKEVEVPSHDGELVPLSIIYSNKITLDGNNPTLLEAYGSYGVSMNAQFDLGLLVWLRMGGIYAVAHVRGGSEKGNNWYKAGFKDKKPNTWKDFTACAEYLISQKYTSSQKLAAKGSSAGGIPVGMSIVERPELFKAAILQVSGFNALRYENMRSNFSISEFGTVKDSTEFNYLYAMDIYQHIKEGIQYPSMLITGQMNDELVDVWQPAKAVARFQEVSKGKNNVILFKVGDSGHNGNADRVSGEVDNYSFLFWQLNNSKFKLK